MKLKFIIGVVGILSACGFTNAPSLDTTQEEQDNNWVIGPFHRPEGVNPVISPQPTEFYCPMRKQQVKWEESDTFNPAATTKDGKIIVLYRAEDNSAQGIGKRTSRVGYAESKDGIEMKRMASPVLFPAEDNFKDQDWPGGCEDPRVAMTEDGLYVMLYTAWNRKKARLAVATSRDLKNWTKHGLAFDKAYNGRFNNLFCKSGSILTKLKGNQLVIDKVDGKYLMYWGEYAVYAATSDNLIDWYPVLDEKNELMKIIQPRKGHFDSLLTECGPPAVRTKHGIVLQILVELADGSALAQLRLVFKQLQQVARAGQTDIRIHVDLVDAAVRHIHKLRHVDAEGVFELAAQHVDALNVFLRHGGRAMADQIALDALVQHALLRRNRDFAADLRVLALVRAVAGAVADGQRVAAGLLEEIDRLHRVGVGARRGEHVILHARQHAQLALDAHAVGMRQLDDLAGQFNVLLVGQAAAVDHHGGVAAVDAGLDALDALAVIQMQRNRHRAVRAVLLHRVADALCADLLGLERAVHEVQFAAHKGVGGLRALQNRAGMEQLVDSNRRLNLLPLDILFQIH